MPRLRSLGLCLLAVSACSGGGNETGRPHVDGGGNAAGQPDGGWPSTGGSAGTSGGGGSAGTSGTSGSGGVGGVGGSSGDGGSSGVGGTGGDGGSGGQPACLNATDACTDNSQCCSGLSCDTTSLGQVCCGMATAPCATANGEDCCGDLLCDQTSLGQVCCGDVGHACATTNGEDCCGDLLCVNGKCANGVLNFKAPFPCGQTWTYSHHSQEVRRALDFINTSGTTNGQPVLASEAGYATRHYEAGGAGNYIVIQHSGGWKTYYFHLSSFSVADGVNVNQGQEVGKVGSTGASSGPHIHYEQLLNGVGKDIVIDGKALAPYPGSYYQKSITSTNCN
jgi:hypothetical protein